MEFLYKMMKSIFCLVILNLIQLILTKNSSSSYTGKQNEKIREISPIQILNDQNQTNTILQSAYKSNDNYQEIVFNATDNLSLYDNNNNINNYSKTSNDSINRYYNNSNKYKIININITKNLNYSEPSSPLSSSSLLSSISYSSNDFFFKLNTSIDDEYFEYQFLNDDEKFEYSLDRENTTKNSISIYSLLNLHFEKFLKTKKNKLVDIFRTIKESGIIILTYNHI